MPDTPIPATADATKTAAPRGDGDKRRGHYGRSRHRSASHESAHADGSAVSGPVPDHPLVPRGNADLITDDAGLTALVQELREAETFAYDSEFIGEASYQPKLCLVQVATSRRLWLIDPLANLTLQPFWELLCDASVRKIVHA